MDEIKPVKAKVPRVTQKMKDFASEYILDFNATQAAIRAKYSKKTAGSMGAENLKKPQIQALIAVAIEEAAKIRKSVLRHRVLQELESIAFAELSDDHSIVTEIVKEPIIKNGVDTGETREVEVQFVRHVNTADSKNKRAIASMEMSEKGVIKIKYHSKTRALELLGKYDSMFTDKVEHSGAVSVQILDDIPDESAE